VLPLAFCTISSGLCWGFGRFFYWQLSRKGFCSIIDRRSPFEIDEKIAANGFTVTLYLRLLFFPFTPMNFGMALSRISFAQYFWGTFFGIIAGGFAMTFFFATLAEVWSTGGMETLWDWKSLLSLALFVGSFFIPKVVKHFKPEI